MIKINSKESIKRKLLSELLDSREPITVTKLAQSINKTGRTLRSYLDEIELEYKKYNLEIIRKTNVGVYINIDEENRAKLKNSFEEESSNSINKDSFSSKYRRVYILKTLFEDKFSYTIQLFADELYCSKSTIVNDLIYVQSWLEDHNLTLKRRQNQGLWIEGSEKDYRIALKDLLYDIKEKDSADFDEGIDQLDYRIDFVNYKRIKNMFPKINLYCIQDVIHEAEKELGCYFTDQAFLNLITHIAIAIERVKNNKVVSVNQQHLESLKAEREYNVAEWVVNELGKRFKISFGEEEIGYISMHMLGAKIQENYDAREYSNLIEEQDKNYVSIAKNIVEMSSEILNIDLTEDTGLLTRLILHLRPTIMRLKYGLKLTNPILRRIKQEYISIFAAAWACSSIFERKLGIAINEDEVGYIALHIALSVENIKNKLKSKVKTVVVCSSGIGTSQLVASKLSKKFDNLEITRILPLNLLNQDIKEQSDLIITTIKNVKYHEKVIYISTLVNDNDLTNIGNAINKFKNSSKKILKQEKIHEKQNSIFERELCFLNSEIADFSQAIAYYGKLMEDRGDAKKGFYENILEREKKGSTYIGKGIAIPHARDIYVNKSKICIVKFKNPITWQDNQLDFIIILCLKFKDVNNTKKFFKNFYSILENDEMISKMKNAESIDHITSIFVEGGYINE